MSSPPSDPCQIVHPAAASAEVAPSAPSPVEPGLESEALPPATAADYVAMARPDHWPKHVFIVPGIVLAWILHPRDPGGLVLPVLLGFASACAIASANYVLNEWLDLPFDRHHPKKSSRPAVRKKISARVVMAVYLGLTAVGLGLAGAVSPLFFGTSTAFLLSGLAYNVPGIRTKDRPYLDVVS
ncbi:MAG: UbiA family prenyltransferase, partial [Holophagales bacterium]|nr:UbiA family prenyltransferase [Holophagales bacterium]